MTYTEYNVTHGFGTPSPTVMRREADRAGNYLPDSGVADTLFDFYRTELCRSEDVTIRIKFPPDSPNNNWWNFHVMTGAGIKSCDTGLKQGTFYVADPDNRNKIMGGAYTDEIVRARYPYGDGVPLPVPPAIGTDAERTRNYEALTLDPNGCIKASLRVPTYVGACIFNITAISPIPIPEPATWLLLATVLLGLLGYDWRRRQRGVTARPCPLRHPAHGGAAWSCCQSAVARRVVRHHSILPPDAPSDQVLVNFLVSDFASPQA